MTSLRQRKMDKAKAYIIAHSDETKEMQAVGADVSPALIALARAQLIKQGLLLPSRKAKEAARPVKPAREPKIVTEPRSPKAEDPIAALKGDLADHDAMVALADMLDQIENGQLDDQAVQKKLLRQALHFAFNPRLHADTRMSASQMWMKLKDQQRVIQLGPGIPTTFEAGVERLRDLHVACGPAMVLAAVSAAFEVQGEGKVAADDNKAESGATGATPAP